MRSPANSLPNHAPASSRRSSARVSSCTAPLPLVVRSTVLSWIATNRASRESCKSVSINVAPMDSALRNDAMVFSCAWPEAPRCAITSTLSRSYPLPARFADNPTHPQKFRFLPRLYFMLTPADGPLACTLSCCALNLTLGESNTHTLWRKDHEKGTSGPLRSAGSLHAACCGAIRLGRRIRQAPKESGT